LEYYPNSYEDWMFARRIKEERASNAPINTKVSKFATTCFYKFLVAVSGDKERAMEIKLSFLRWALFIDFNLRELANDKVIQGIAVAVFFVSCWLAYNQL